MNFDFSDDQKQLRDEARKFLAEKCPPKAVRAVLDGKAPYDKELWKGLAEMGLLGVAIPEEFGGAGAGHLELCVLAEEMGRALAPVPFSSTVYLAAEALLLAGSDAQKKKWLPKIASGEAIGTLALFEGKGNPSPKAIKLAASGGTLNGMKKPVPDGAIADFAVVAARTGSTGRDADISLFLVDLKAGGVEVKALTNVDPTARPGRTHLQELQGRAARRRRRGLELLTAGARPRRGADGVRAGRRRRPRAGDGPRLRARPYRLRPADRLVPGGQAHARRHVCLGDAGALELLLRRLGALDQRVGIAGSRRRRAHQRDAGVPALRQEQHPGPWRHGLHLGVRLPHVLPPRQRHRARRSAACPIGKMQLIDRMRKKNAA